MLAKSSQKRQIKRNSKLLRIKQMNLRKKTKQPRSLSRQELGYSKCLAVLIFME